MEQLQYSLDNLITFIDNKLEEIYKFICNNKFDNRDIKCVKKWWIKEKVKFINYIQNLKEKEIVEFIRIEQCYQDYFKLIEEEQNEIFRYEEYMSTIIQAPAEIFHMLKIE